LILYGASTVIKNALGDTPATLAKRCGHHELVLLFGASEKQAQFTNSQAQIASLASNYGTSGSAAAGGSVTH